MVVVWLFLAVPWVCVHPIYVRASNGGGINFNLSILLQHKNKLSNQNGGFFQSMTVTRCEDRKHASMLEMTFN